jgi:maltose alpha-D-glucosyltransferase/alpha-amylase
MAAETQHEEKPGVGVLARADVAGFAQKKRSRPRGRLVTRERDPVWYKDAIIYEMHVRAFLDSNADGIGDFRGLAQKLDYLQDLGVTALWLLPFYPSPLRDDGYDIADYYSINPIYGTLKDFKAFLAAAHEHDLRVITELVVNHTSDQHPWFAQSRRAKPGSPWRDYYVWSDTPEKYREARIIFRDFEPSNWTWDPIGQAYYWHRFYSHQPDLNYDNPQVHKEIERVLDFWLDLGVDGLRLDAVPYLYERDGTSCENLAETHSYLKSLRRHVDEKYGDRMLLAEANQWPEDAVTYFGAGKGDECHMAFHFPLMPRLFMSVRMEDRVPILDILQQTPSIPETSQWALFLRNHDELTLEMVTDEERDYMYRVYANDAKARINLGIRRRLAPLLGNDRKRVELLNLLLFSLPGTPVIYYGDEIGMGDNVFLGDRNGVRTPMQWSSDKNAGFSRASPQALYFPIILDPEYHYEAVNVENQMRNPNSLFWWMKQTLTLRKRYKAFGRGSLQFLHPENRKVLAFVRSHEKENILVIANLSRFPQPVRLDLSKYQNMVPVELFGRADFPAIDNKPYFLTLNPHAAFWFSLEPTAPQEPVVETRLLPAVPVRNNWEDIFEGQARFRLEERLRMFFAGKSSLAGKRQPKSIKVRDVIQVRGDSVHAFLLLLQAEYMEGEPYEYLMPVELVTGGEKEQFEQRVQHLITRLRLRSQDLEAALYDGVPNREFSRALLQWLARRRSFRGKGGQIQAVSTHRLQSNELLSLEPSIRSVDYSNLCILFGDRYFLKLFRRLEPGINPDLELGEFLTEADFPNAPPVVGYLEYRRHNGEQMTLGVLTEFLANAQDAWAYTLDTLSRYFDRVRTSAAENRPELPSGTSLLKLSEREVPQDVVALIGTFLESARLLGRRVGELHLTLACRPENRDFAPEPFTPFYQRALYQSMRNLLVQELIALRLGMERVPENLREAAAKVLSVESEVLTRLHGVTETRMEAKRIRCHGDLHLGQILWTGKDFVFIDFEGEARRPIGERRIKRSPLRDVASLVRSFDYIVHIALHRQVELGTLGKDDLVRLDPWTNFWHQWVSAVFVHSYLAVVAESDLLPRAKDQLAVLLDAHLLEKVIHELSFELNNRRHLLGIPLQGILRLVGEKSASN